MTTRETTEESIAMKDYVSVVWRQRGMVLATALIVTLVGIALTGLSPEVFESEVVIHLSPDSGRVYAEAPSAVAAILASPFLERVARELEMPERGRALKRMVQAVPTGEGKLVRVRIRHRDPELSQRLTNAIALAFITRASELVRRKREVAEAQLREIDDQLTEIERFSRSTRNFVASLQTGRAQGLEGVFSRSFALNAMGATAGQLAELHAMRRRLEQELLVLEPPTLIELAAVPAELVAPHRVRNIALSLLLGAMVGVALAFIAESVKSPASAPLPKASDAARSRSI